MKHKALLRKVSIIGVPRHAVLPLLGAVARIMDTPEALQQP